MWLGPARSVSLLARSGLHRGTVIPIPVSHYIPRSRLLHSTRIHLEQQSSPSLPSASPQVDTSGNKTPIGQIQRRLQITFTCTATVPPPSTATATTDPEADHQHQPCHHRSTHEFSRTSYEKGIVLIECPGCGNRHLIADNLQWFSSTPSTAHPTGLPIGSEASRQPRTVEQLMREKGEEVVWVDGGEQGGTWMVEG